MSEYIITFTGKHISPLEPDPKDISIEDIAHALSMMTRANGHFPQFYSVAQHCIHCAEEALAQNRTNRIVLACLLHDASEAYLADITRPVKKSLVQYLEIEKKFQDAVYGKFLGNGLTAEEEEMVKQIDDTLLYYEFNYYMKECFQKMPPAIISRPVFETRPFKQAEQQYLEMFSQFYRKKDNK